MVKDTLLYFVALDIFALTALGMAVVTTPGKIRHIHNRFLVALFGLVLIRSTTLLLILKSVEFLPPLLGSLEVLSLICIIWALCKSSTGQTIVWKIYVQVGLLIVMASLVIMWIIPHIAWQAMVSIIAISSLPLVFSRYDHARRSHVAPPLILMMAALLNWFEFNNTSQFVALMGYGALVYAVFVETVICARIQYQTVESLGSETNRFHDERLRHIAVSKSLITTNQPAELLDHAVYTIAEETKFDQVVLITLEYNQGYTAHIAAIYKRGDSNTFLPHAYNSFNLSNTPILLDVVDGQETLTFPPFEEMGYLNSLYMRWQEMGAGPTILQPLLLDQSVNQKVVGVLILGNPTSKQALTAKQVRLAQYLAPQLASMIVYQNQYRSVKWQNQEFTTALDFAQKELQQTAHVIEALTEGVVMSDKEGRIYIVNQAAEQILQQSRQVLLGQPISMIYNNISSTQSIEQLMTQLNRNNQPLPTYYEQNEQIIKGLLLPLRNNKQEWLGMVAIFRDVSHNLNQKLKLESSIDTDFLETLRRQALTPLQAASSYADLMMTQKMGGLDIQQMHFMKVIKGSIDKVSEMINKTTQAVNKPINRLDADNYDFKLALNAVNIKQVIALATDSVIDAIKAKDIQLTTSIAPNLPLIQADSSRLQQALGNLLYNACRFTPANGEISLRAALQSEGLNGHRTDYLVISVLDSGGDLSVGVQQQFFQKVHTAYDATVATNQAVDVVALGLTMVKEIVEGHGGRIWGECFEEKGSVFHLALPVEDKKLEKNIREKLFA